MTGRPLGYQLAVAALLVLFARASACTAQQTNKPQPTLADVSYGPHERNVFDLWLAPGEGPRPLVVYIHGGGFVGGDKSSISANALQSLLKAGISVAAVNYRFHHQAPLPAPLHDGRRAVQTLRARAAEWNIDPNAIGAYGGSAGAVTCMYLGFHDDMASPESPDPVERESTRLVCVATLGGQTTLDSRWWREQIPGFKNSARLALYSPQTWGMSDAAFEEFVHTFSALHLASQDDPPIWMGYGMRPNDPLPKESKAAFNFSLHHVAFGVALKQKLDELGVENHLYYQGAASPTYPNLTDFLREKLTKDN